MRLSVILPPFFLLLLLAPVKSFALACYEDTGDAWNANKTKATITEALGAMFAVPADAPDGTVIWESAPRTIPVKCSDDLGGGNEAIYFYVNPASMNIGQGIRAGIRYRGQSITQSSGQVFTGHRSHDGCNWAVCNGWTTRFTLSFSVYIEKFGQTPQSGQATTEQSYRVFQLDGAGGLNNPPTKNLNYIVTGIDKIRFVPCSPKLTVTPSMVNFGSLSPVGGEIGAQIASSGVNLGLKRDCNTPYTVNARFTPKTGSVQDGLLVPANNPSVGISLLRAENKEKLAYNSWFKLTDMTGENPASVDLLAQLFWRTKPVLGPFEAAVVIDMFYQ